MESVERLSKILSALSQAPYHGISLKEVAKSVKLPTTSTHRMLKALVAEELVFQDPITTHYRLGSHLLRLANDYLSQIGFLEAVGPYIADVSVQTGMQTIGAVLEGNHAICVAIKAPPQASKFFAQVGRHLPVHASAGGKALIANLPMQRQEILLPQLEYSRYTPATISSSEELMRNLERGKEQGYWECNEELEPGVSALAVAVLGPGGRALLSLTVTGVSSAFIDRKGELVETLTSTSKMLTSHMGSLLASTSFAQADLV